MRRSAKARKPKTESRAKKKDAVLRLESADQRAALRYQWVVALRAGAGGYGTRRKHLIAKIEAGEISCPPLEPGETVADVVWTREHCRRMINLPPEKVSIEALREKPGKGRPKTDLDPRLMEVFEREVRLQRYPSDRALWRDLCTVADDLDIKRPAPAKIYALLKETPYVALVAAKNGTMAARADAVPGSSTGAYWPHHMWALDELTIPVWIRIWVNRVVGWIAVKVDACIVIDVFSQVILGWHIANPLRRGALRGVDRFDVFGAACSALFPDLAHPDAIDLVGSIPHTLRYDKAKAHDLAGKRFRLIGTDVPTLPGYQPWLRAEVEAVVGIIKSMCWKLDGYDEKWGVAEYEADPAWKKRKMAVAQKERLPTHVHATIDQLLTLNQLRSEFGQIVTRYNQSEHEGWQTTREARFFNALPEAQVRPWTDAMILLQPKRVEVGKSSLRYRGTTFAPKVGSRMMEVGENVSFRPDPLLRGVFVQEGPTIDFLPLKSEWAKDVSGPDIAREQSAIAAHHSALGRAARQQYQAEQLGDTGAALASAVERRGLDAAKTATRAAQPTLDAQKDAVVRAQKTHAASPAGAEDDDSDTVMPVSDVPAQEEFRWVGEDAPSETPIEEDPATAPEAMPRTGRSRKAASKRGVPARSSVATTSVPNTSPTVPPADVVPAVAVAGGNTATPRRRGVVTTSGALLRLLK